MVSHDVLWKGLIEDLAEDFLLFFYDDFVDLIDWSKPFDFLDKELYTLVPEAEAINRRADKLFKVWLKNGEEQWFLVHTEVQGYEDKQFALRMFQYFYRIRDRYARPVTAIVIYTDTNRKYHFKEYRESFMGTELSYRFHTFVLTDQDKSALESSGNPFGIALAFAKDYKTFSNKGDDVIFDYKLRFVRRMLEAKIDKSKVRYLMNFIGQFLPFQKSEFSFKFEEQVQKITKSRKAMGIEEAIIQELKAQALREGRQKGIEKGLQEGREEGRKEGREEGREEGRLQKTRLFVFRADRKGMSVADIAELVDLPAEKVEALIQEVRLNPPKGH